MSDKSHQDMKNKRKKTDTLIRALELDFMHKGNEVAPKLVLKHQRKTITSILQNNYAIQRKSKDH